MLNNIWAYRTRDGRIANYDADKQIHYGVISQNSVMSEIWESFDPVYILACPHCNTESEESECPNCHADNLREFEFVDEPSYYKYTGGDGYVLEYVESLSAFYVIQSPYYTHAAYCFHCAPNAGDLDTPRNEDTGIKTYALDASFFENNKTPYTVYPVE